MRKHLKIMANYFRLNLSSALEYRAGFFTQAFGMALNNGTFVFFWWIAFEQIGGRIAGYSFEDVMFLWAVTSGMFGLGRILFANASDLSRLIMTGELDTFLLQPCSVLLNVLCAKTDLSAYGDLLYGFILMTLVHGGNAAAWGWFLYGTIIGAALFTAVTLTAHSLTFYLQDASVIGDMVMEFFVNFSIYPDKIYTPAVRAVMYSVIPAGLVVHLPLSLVYDFSPWIFAAGLGGTVLYLMLAAWVFHSGLRRYESGNGVALRR